VRTLYQDAVSLPAPGVIDHVSVQQAIWLLVRVSSDLDAKEREDLQELCQASSELAALHRLAQTFGQIVRKRERGQLPDWMKQVEASSFRQVKRFVAGLQRDQEEVLAGLTEVYSNGQVEGFVNKLKLIKRMVSSSRCSFSSEEQNVCLDTICFKHSETTLTQKESPQRDTLELPHK
jgi:hypothetical protein